MSEKKVFKQTHAKVSYYTIEKPEPMIKISELREWCEIDKESECDDDWCRGYNRALRNLLDKFCKEAEK